MALAALVWLVAGLLHFQQQRRLEQANRLLIEFSTLLGAASQASRTVGAAAPESAALARSDLDAALLPLQALAAAPEQGFERLGLAAFAQQLEQARDGLAGGRVAPAELTALAATGARIEAGLQQQIADLQTQMASTLLAALLASLVVLGAVTQRARHGGAERERYEALLRATQEEHRSIGQALAGSETTNRVLMNALADGVFVAQDFRFVFANPALPAMLGYAPEEFVGLAFERVIAPEVLPLWVERFIQRVGNGVEPVGTYEVRFLTREGTQIELELVASRTSYEDRPAVLGVVRDITERKRIQAELERHRHHLEELVAARARELQAATTAREETEDFARTITDNQPTLLAYVDRDLTVRFANRAYLEWFGLTRDQIIGRSAVEVLGEQALRGREEIVTRVLAGEALELPNQLEGSDGRLGDFWTYRLPRVRDGRVEGYYFIASEVTAIRQAERRLRELNDALVAAELFTRTIADNIPGRIAYWDRELRCLFVNRFYCEWFGMPREAMTGRTVEEIFEGGSAWRSDPHVLGALAGEVQQFERDEISHDGRRATTLVHYIPDRHDAEADPVKGFFVLAIDVTAAEQAKLNLQTMNLALVEARDRAEAAARAKSAFLANMSHEIRTPMNAIIGLTHLLRRDSTDPLSRDRLTRVADAARHLLDIINDILDLSKIESGKLVLEQNDFALDALLTRACALVAEPARDKGLELVIDTDHLPRTLRGDATRLSQALVNLLSNAVKFTERGSIALRGSLLATRGDEVDVQFEVRDTGIGIPAHRLPYLFNAFEQADSSTTRRFGGTGLGLAITRHLAQMMGGDAGVQSEPGVGSRFWITARLQTGEAAPVDTRDTLLSGLHALLVDDVAEAREAMGAMLRALGLRTDTAVSGACALALVADAAAADDPYDVVLIDWLMPHMDGFETARRLLAAVPWRPPKCIMVSISADERMREQALQLGISGLLQKPVSYSTLHDHLVGLLVDHKPEPRPSALDLAAEQRLRTEHQGARLLLAEDNPVNQEVALTLLHIAGLDVDVAETGTAAVAMALRTPYDLILMDMQMPELDGLQATRAIRAQSPATAGEATPIIAMTANAFDEDRAACLAAGMNDYLTKPVDPPQLYDMLLRWLGNEPEAPDARIAALAEGAVPPPAASARPPTGLPPIEGLDVQRGLVFFAGRHGVYRRALQQFVSLYERGIAPIDAYLADPATPLQAELRRELHSMGGASAALGATSLSTQAARAGTLLRDPANPDPRPALASIAHDLDRLVGALREALAEADAG
jgi:PAS domain S-box-containing protein